MNNPYTVQGDTGLERSRYTARNLTKFTSATMPGDPMRRINTNFDPGNIQNNLSTWLRGGAGPGGISRAPQETTQQFFIGPGGIVLPYTQEAADAVEAGLTPPSAGQLMGGYATSTDSPNRIDVPGILTPDGQIVTPDPQVAATKFAEAKQKAYNKIIQDRMRNGLGMPRNPVDQRAVDQQAEQQALSDMSIYIGGSDTNYPKSVAGPNAVPEYKPGQFFPTFDSAQPRSLTDDEAEVLNFIRNSGVIPDSSNVLRYLFDPKVSNEQKATILSEASGAMNKMALESPSADDSLYWSWNPLEMAGQLLLKGIDTLGIAYNDFIIPSYTWTVSALPGGVRTASFDEARDVAPGQMTAAVLGPRAATLFNGPLQMAGSTIGAVAEGVNSGNWGNLAKLQLGFGNALLNDEASWKDIGNDIYNAEARQMAFVDDYYGSQISGGIGFAVNIVWDPLWLAGPIGKGVRVSHVLGMGAGAIRNFDDVAKVSNQLKTGEAVTRPYDLAVKNLAAAERSGDEETISLAREAFDSSKATKDAYMGSSASPIERFTNWVIDPKNGKPRTAEEIRQHAVINFSTVTNEMAIALERASSFEEASVIMRAGFGEKDAMEHLRAMNADTARTLESARVQVQIDNMLSAPDKYVKAYSKMYDEVSSAADEVRRLEASMLPEPLTRVRSNPPIEGQVVDGYSRRFFTGFGDEAQRRDVVRTRAEFFRNEDIAEELRLEGKIADLRLTGAPQEQIDSVMKALDEQRAISRQNFFARAEGAVEPEELRLAQGKLADALDRFKMLDEAALGTPRTEAQIADTRLVLEQAIREDEMLRAAIEAERGLTNIRQVNFGLTEGRGTEGLSRFNVYGRPLANYREGVRQRKAERKAFQRETHRGANPLKGFNSNGWIRESYRRGADRTEVIVWKPVRGTAEATADVLTRPLTYSTMETASGIMVVARGAFSENWREAQATLDNLKMYGDNSTVFTLPNGQAVTGAQRKADILARLSRDLNNPNLDPTEVVKNFEKDIVMDMARMYAPAKDSAKFAEEISDMYKHFDFRRGDQIEKFKEQTFWVDDRGRPNVSPFLESQLAQGLPLMDFRRLERLVRDYSNGGRRLVPGSKRTRFTQATQDVKDQLELAQATEARLTALSERQARMAELKGLNDPRKLRREAAKGDRSAQILLEKMQRTGVETRKTQAELKRLDEALQRAYQNEALSIDKDLGPGLRFQENAIGWYDQFNVLWRAGVLFRVGYPVRNSIDGLARRIAFEASVVPVLQDAVTGSRNLVSNAIAGRQSTNIPGLSRAGNARKSRIDRKIQEQYSATGKLPEKVLKWADQEADRIVTYRDNVAERRQALDNVIEQFRAEDKSHLSESYARSFDAQIYDLVSKRRAMDADLERLNRQLAPFEEANEADLILAYRQSLDRPRRVGDEFVFGVSGDMYYGMMADPRYGPILAQEVSAREAQQASLGLSLDIARSTMRTAEVLQGGVVTPGAPNYYEALAYGLNNHVRNSVVGDLWMRGVKVPDAARELMRRSGDRFRANVGANVNKDRYVDKATKGRRKKAKKLNKEQRRELADVRSLELRLNDAERELDNLDLSAGKKGVVERRARAQELNDEVASLREQLNGRTSPKVMTTAQSDDPVALTAYWMEANGLSDYDDVLETVRYMYDQFDNYVPNDQVRQSLLRGQVSPDFLRTAMPADKWPLAAVHGEEISLTAGSGKVLSVAEKINPYISKVYELIGSMPEDLLIRVPFASRRYRESIETGTSVLAGFYPDGRVPAWAVESMLKQARARAIRDVKTYMYTQDRRTNFGRVLERVVPFVSAWQNSVVAYSRMVKMNPEVLPFFEQAYLAPERLGLVDEEGNVRVPIPAALSPITDAMGYDDEWVYDLNSLAVMPAQIDPLLTFRSGPIIQMTASELMRAGLFSPAIPRPLSVALQGMGLDESGAQEVWSNVQRLTFGTDPETGNPIAQSPYPLAFDKALPPFAQKAVQAIGAFVGGPEADVRYATQYTRIAREEMLRYFQGERDTLPTMDEVKGMTNVLYITRMLNNLVGITGGPFGAVTPPGIDSDIFSMQETYRLVQDTVGYEQADQVFTDLFGDEAMLLANYSATRGRGGMPVTTDALAIAEKYSGLVASVATTTDPQGLSILGYMLSDGQTTSDDYEEQVRITQLTSNIPGTTIPWREPLAPQEQTNRAAVDTGWMMYTQTMNAIYADMRARGLNSLNAADAEDLRGIRDNFLERMRTDPLYAAWHKDYEDGSIKRIGASIDFLRTITSDEGFMAERGDNEQDMWQTAIVWINTRNQYRAALNSVKGQSDVAVSELRAAWEVESSAIAETNLRFNEFWVRYLDQDDLTVD
jgi:hypothetical protein